MKQTRWVSFIEVSMNIASGFLLAMMIWHYIVPTFYPHLTPTWSENFTMTAVFTVASMLRGYIWRRLFNNGFYQTMVRCFRKLGLCGRREKVVAAGQGSDKVGGDGG